MTVYLLSDNIVFPPPSLADKDGLLAIGGDLHPSRLLLAYQLGIFPWFSDGDPILWWSPDPRLILYPTEIKISKRLKRVIGKNRFRITMDTDFEAVIRKCASVPRKSGEGTWITHEMVDAYCRLHDFGYAHSVETWVGDNLAGGLYGVSLGRCFFGESMYTEIPDASKIALVALTDYLVLKDFEFIDCQVSTDHLIRLGAIEIPRNLFLKKLESALRFSSLKGKWKYSDNPE